MASFTASHSNAHMAASMASFRSFVEHPGAEVSAIFFSICKANGMSFMAVAIPRKSVRILKALAFLEPATLVTTAPATAAAAASNVASYRDFTCQKVRDQVSSKLLLIC